MVEMLQFLQRLSTTSHLHALQELLGILYHATASEAGHLEEMHSPDSASRPEHSKVQQAALLFASLTADIAAATAR